MGKFIRCFVGVTSVAIPERAVFSAQPVAIRTKKPSSQEREIAEKRAARQQEIDYSPFSATATSIVIATAPEGSDRDVEKLIVEYTESVTPGDLLAGKYRPGELAYNALRKLAFVLDHTNEGEVHINAPAINYVGMTSLIGIRIRQNMQLMAADAMRYCAVHKVRFDIPSSLWCHPNFKTPIWTDPYETTVPVDQRQWVRYEQLADYLCIERPSANMEQDAAEQVRFAVRLAKAANL